jgi:hypothetical protein
VDRTEYRLGDRVAESEVREAGRGDTAAPEEGELSDGGIAYGHGRPLGPVWAPGDELKPPPASEEIALPT